MTPLPVTLLAAAAAAFLNTWLGWRIATLRAALKVSVGDGGEDALLRRMRAQANFIENAPIFLILLVALELSGGNRWLLASAAAAFLLARVAHGVGMDGGAVARWRAVGMMTQTLALAVLAVYAIVCALGCL